MPYDAFPANAPSPVFPLEIDRSPRIRKAQFGEGYSQRGLDALNTQVLKVHLSWVYISEAERDIIMNFLDAKNGVTPFTYQLPDEVSARQWVCEKFRETKVAADRYFVDIDLEENFDP